MSSAQRTENAGVPHGIKLHRFNIKCSIVEIFSHDKRRLKIYLNHYRPIDLFWIFSYKSSNFAYSIVEICLYAVHMLCQRVESQVLPHNPYLVWFGGWNLKKMRKVGNFASIFGHIIIKVTWEGVRSPNSIIFSGVLGIICE